MANYKNIDPNSPAGKRGFQFGTRSNRIVYTHCGHVARIIQQIVMPLYPQPSAEDKCREFVACVKCGAEARIASGCEKNIPHTHFGFTLIRE